MNKNTTKLSAEMIKIGLIVILSFFTTVAYTQTIQGVVRDSITGEPIPYATVRIDKTNIGMLSDDDGKFKFTNKSQSNVLVCSLMGYNPKTIKIPVGQSYKGDILLRQEGIRLDEVVVRPGKEKYSKKNNPAVELVKKVIANKDKYTIQSQDHYHNEEYDRLFFALNEFEADKGMFKKMKFLTKYMDSSKIDKKQILPFSVRETLSSVYYQKNPKDTRRVIKAYKTEGLDQGMNLESLDGVIKEIFQNINITDNSINLLFHDFVGPLSTHSAVNFYKWYILDTVNIENKRYVNLGFVPFNTRDVGFSGSLFIATDSTYAIKRVTMRVPTKINLNFVQEMFIQQEFEQVKPDLWIPKEFITAIDASFYGAVKLYIEKIKNFEEFVFNEPVAPIFLNPSPEIFISGYKKQDAEYWDKNRPTNLNHDYKMDDMMTEFMSNKFINFTVKAANIMSAGYVATNADEEKNKIDLGTTLTFFSHNALEGGRFRLTGATTTNFHKHLYLYGYGAYGLKDEKFKYMGEATWAFNKKEYHKDEFPINNLSVSYKYDVNALGQRFLQAERDNIFLSGRSSKSSKETYDRMMQIAYHREYYGGFSYKLFAQTHNEQAAGNLVFQKKDDAGNLYSIDRLKTTELGLGLRYAPNEKFFQQRRLRRALPSQSFIFDLGHTIGLKNVLGGDFRYNRTSFAMSKQFWIPPFGKIYTTVQAEKIWGEVPFSLLLSPSANNSYTVQKGSFYLVEPLEFISDAQVTWNVEYKMKGWLLNRIPVIKLLKWREVFGFRGFIGDLSKRNNPEFNNNVLVFPDNSYTTNRGPYMEYNVGVENIFNFFRIDYVRRINYLDHPNINKDGFRISFDVTF